MRVAVVLATERGSHARQNMSARPTADALRPLPLAAATDISTSRAAILLFPVKDVGSVCDAIGEALKTVRHPQEMVVGMSAPSAVSADSLALLYAAASVAAGCVAVDPALPRCVSWPQLSLYRHLLTTSEQAPALLPLPTQPASLLGKRSRPSSTTLATYGEPQRRSISTARPCITGSRAFEPPASI